VGKHSEQANMAKRKKHDPNNGIAEFLNRAVQALRESETSYNLEETKKTRTQRKFSIKDVCECLNMTRMQFDRFLRTNPVPQGELRGREVSFTAEEIMRLRIVQSTRHLRVESPDTSSPRSKSKKTTAGPIETMFWRKPGDQLPVIVVGSQKGGSGKSITACNLALYCQLYYGLRVGVIDADPQATASLYFATDKMEVGALSTRTFTNFMGMQEPGQPLVQRDVEELAEFWKPTAWPGVKLLPGGPSIQEADINLHFLFRKSDPLAPKFHELLKITLDRYDEAHPPKTTPADMVDDEGNIIEDRYQEAMSEAFDIIIIDCAPALSLTMLNPIVAGTSLIIPTPLRGFDLNTVRHYTASAADMINYLVDYEGLSFPPLPSFILPTIMTLQNQVDLKMLKGLIDDSPDIICPIFYKRSEAVANAAEHYHSLYEYVPTKGKKKSADDFLMNANAVGDSIISKCVPRLPTRGFANKFVLDMYGGFVPSWTEEDDNVEASN
jgi:chromosome partitioning protein